MSAFLARPPAGFAAPSRMRGRPPRKPAPAGLLKYFTPVSPSRPVFSNFHTNTLRKTLDSRVHKSPLAFATIRAIDPTSYVPDACTILPAAGSQTAGSQKPPSPPSTMSSSQMDMDDPETLLGGSQKTPKKTPKKPLQYPADIPRLTRFGRGTYGIKTGPLPDGTDWSELSVDIIKEQLMMRNVPTDGRKQVLVNRLQNWQTYYDGQTVDVRPAAEGFDPADEGASSTPKSTKKPRNGVPVNDHRHIMSTKKAMTQRMYIIKQYANEEWGDPNRLSLAVRGAGADIYTVTIAHETSCTCSAAKFNPRSNCKHVIYVLTHVLRAPAEILPQRRISDDELATIFARAPKIRPTQAEIDNDPAFKDGVPKSKEGKDCIVCYQAFGDLETVCCGTCGHHAHTGCFATFAHESSGWGTKCPTCQAKWNPAGKSEQDV